MTLSFNSLNTLNGISITHSFYHPSTRLILALKTKTFTVSYHCLKVSNILQSTKNANINTLNSQITSVTTPDSSTNSTTTPNSQNITSSTKIILNFEEDRTVKKDENSRKPASIDTIIKNSFVKENDVPWTGEEDLKDTILRMIVDKYPPLKVKRESVKDYMDAHSSKSQHNNLTNLPNYLSNHSIIIKSKGNVDSSDNKLQKKKEKLEKVRERNQSRIINAREAATDYAIGKKYGDNNEQKKDILPKSIAAWNSIVEQRIQEAITEGKFKNLQYHGKPLPLDENEKKQGAAPAWIESQKDVEREISLFRRRMLE
ncbi:11584_t:CDS:2, partial [Racocetra fulgida]